MRLLWSLILVALAGVRGGVADTSVDNVIIRQLEGTRVVEVQYDLFSSDASSVRVELHVSDGTSFFEELTLMGDVGNGVSVGAGKVIQWHGSVDLAPEYYPDLDFVLKVYADGGTGMALIPGGTNSDGNYSLTVDPFYMDTSEVTKATWDFVANTSAKISAATGDSKAPNHPVLLVTWYDAVMWCNARSEFEGLTPCYNESTWACNFSANGYRLPTVEEWEYAARGGFEGYIYPWGDEASHDFANYKADGIHHPDFYDQSGLYTAPVGSFAPNGYGLYDMAGNAFEWCNDVAGSGRALKDGAWSRPENYIACSSYHWEQATFQNNEISFRTVRSFPVLASYADSAAYDSRDYALSVASVYGAPDPGIGNNVYSWRSSITCSVDLEVIAGGTNFFCVGWSGSGSVPASGESNSVVVVLDELSSSIEWTWVNEDRDDDGMQDDWEQSYFGNLNQGTGDDHDQDGQSNFDEYIAGTDPTNSWSLFELSFRMSGASCIVEWPCVSNRVYQVYWAPDLPYTGFSAVGTNLNFPRHSFTGSVELVHGFFRVDVRKN